VRKLTRRIGEQTVNDITHELIEASVRERRLGARAVRIDSTVIEADIKYPDRRGPGIARREVARAGGSQADRKAQGEQDAGARPLAVDEPAVARDLQYDSPPQRGGEGRDPRADKANRTAAGALGHRGAPAGRDGKARGRGAQAKLRAAAKLADRCEKVAKQIKQRVAGEKICDRLISLSDPDARPICKGKLGKPNEFGYVAQIAEITTALSQTQTTPNTKRGARGLILPAASLPANPGENQLLPQTVTELQRLGLSPREVALDGGFALGPTTEQLEDLDPSGSSSPHASNPAPDAPTAAYSATAPVPKDHQPPQTACAAAASKAITATRPGPDGPS